MTGSDAKYKFVFLLMSINTISSFNFSNLTQEVGKSNLPSSEKDLQLQKILSEETRWVTFELAGYFNEKQSYRIVSDTADLFDVEPSTGLVTLKNGQVLDYEEPSQRSIQLNIQARALQTGALTRIVLTILVTDINDESPDFKNKPYPFLATVGPNTPANQKVYELYAEDPDTNSNIMYSIDSGAEKRFMIRTETSTLPGGQVVKVGNIYTQGQGRFEENREYTLTCSATDNAVNPVQKTFATVFVRVGFRPPQFYETNFRAYVRENNGINQSLNNKFKIEAKSFQGNALSYKLRTRDNSTTARFSIDADGTIKTQQVLDYESVPREQRPPIYELNVFATEAVTNLQSSAKLSIGLLDDNDNKPVFDLSKYSATHPEDLAMGRSVITVQAQDDDSGVNGELVYSVDHENFAVNTSSTTTQEGMVQSIGTIYVKQPLDYDRLPGHFYSFTVTATDKGSPSSTGTANVRVFMTNVNDEPPEIILYDQKLSVREDANVGEVVTAVQAVDLDRDRVEFYFSPRRTPYDRLKRQVTTTTVPLERTLSENYAGNIYDLASQFPDTAYTYVLDSATSDLFTVSRQGIVNLKSGVRMDYEDDAQRSIQIVINATDINNDTALTRIILTILVTDVNDEIPDFKNKPYPFLATVGPNTPANQKVYELYAEDPDTNSNITYNIDSGAESRFMIRTETSTLPGGQVIKVGNIYTQGQGRFEENREYPLTCSATDNAVNPVQKTFATVFVRVGFRPPQFYETNFRGTVRENNGIDQTLNNGFKIEAKAFQGKALSYELRDADNSTTARFSIDADGTVKTQEVLDYESVPREQRPPIYELNVFATEAVTNLQNSAKLFIEVLDDNDNKPVFDLPRYSATHPEDLAVGRSVITVQAQDDDSGVNGELVYSVDHENFAVNTSSTTTQEGMKQYIGTIYVKKPLDYDRLPGHFYSFTVTATDKGSPSSTGTANVRVFMTNVNDEPPEIILDDQKLSVREDANVGEVVTVVQAVDLDRDRVEFYFSPSRTSYEIFDIIPTSGLIRVSRRVPTDRDEYVLNITAVDDGSCCGSTIQLSSEVYLNVEIVDINTHKPSFPDCSQYSSTTFKENEPPSTPILQIQAVDQDRGENGRVTYSILRGPTQPSILFNIDTDTGDLTSAQRFDRERQSSYSITVKGNDQGIPPLDGYCTFTVSIDDVNDNAPVFDQPRYNAKISQDFQPGHSIIEVRADDADLGINADVIYSLVPSNDAAFFSIVNEAGIIYLNKYVGQQSQFTFDVKATDKGQPPLETTVEVVVTITEITSEPPSWIRNDYDSTPFRIPETAPISYVISTFEAQSNVDDPTVTFSLIDSNGQIAESVPPFVINYAGNIVNLTVFSSMDFNVKNRYEIRLRGSNRGAVVMSSEIHPVIELIDTNNKVPKFFGLDTSTSYYPGSLKENSPPGQTVIEIKAFDEDTTSPNNLLTFSIIDKPGVSDKFEIRKIDDNTAVLLSKVEFDREDTSQLYLDVMVKDGTESSRPYHPPGQPNTAKAVVSIRITDMNDNSPYFTQTYNASVREDASIQESIVAVSAKDPDDAAVLSYSITGGNVQKSFGVQAKTGFVFVARQLDYETEQHVYTLTMNVSDGIYSNSTTVTIHVLDANDNSPVFAEDPYVVTNVVEEDTSITASNPMFLVQVSATDADINRPTNIRYSLLGSGTQPPEKYFDINAETGQLYLLTSLDRDLPSGRATYQFNVRAQDELDPPSGSISSDPPKFGYTSVQVKPIDINDNAPLFISSADGSVMEHSPQDSSVMTVVAIDYDEGMNGTVVYEIVAGPSEISNGFKFSIQPNTGLIQTNTDEAGLDRETTPTYTVKVKASDRGNEPMATETEVTISLDDKNDQIPKFEKLIYQIEMSEALTTGPIGRVKATDDDVGENARLDYSLRNHLDFFSINTDENNNEGSINVFKSVDYENENQRFFNLTVVVQDPEPTHTAVAYVEVTVTDFNDNAPQFVKSRIEVSEYESAPVGKLLAHFSASDADSGMNAIFDYSIDQKTDQGRLFSVDQTGNVTIRKMMDRETQDEHTVHILAIDKGDPAQTGTATLVINVLDVNDNYPIFAKDYRPIVMEDAENINELVQIINAIDKDNDPFGAPFGFKEPTCDGGTTCPCPKNPTCEDFDLQFISNGEGSARVTTKKVFDREETKFYYMPIVMWDMRGKGDNRSQTGTNTLTIEIGDINDHVQKAGHQDIFVYDYKGMFGPLAIGTVYAQDPDDWDVVDKTFTFTGPEYMSKYFTVNKDSGMITMTKGVPSNKAHTFTVNVFDSTWQVEVECTVTVTIQEISEEAVFSSGAVRLKGVTAEEFVIREKIPGGDITAYHTSKYEKFRTFLANMLIVPEENVDVLSVQNNGDFTDVRYSAHGSPYYPASKMNSIVALNRGGMENDVGVSIEMIRIDECADEKFEGGCYNFLNVTEKPALVNSNGTSFVGVEMFVQATEGCRSDFYPQTDECSADYCYNGGTCSQDDWGELHCNCLPGFKGPRCQGTHHSFDGDSYAMYDPLEQCESSRTSLYFITGQENGLILYNGPTADRPAGSEDPTDFISLELVSGYPRLRIDHGSGEVELYIDGRNSHGVAKVQKLSDGKWHRIDILRNGREVEMIIDHCDKAELGPSEVVQDDSMCRKTATTPNDNKFLNVNTLLQLGGRFSQPNYPQGIMPTNFDGCLKYFMHNGKLYDLTVPGGADPEHPSGENQCTREEIICEENSLSGPVCGDNGICESTWQPGTASCVCKPGWFGDKCTEDMNDNSPYFTQTYNASMREDASIQESIVAVSAKDPDDAAVLSYSITGGNVQKSFGVQAKTGVVFVARQLDYETEQHVYTLTMNVSDGIYSNSTTVTIHVLDANDNSPVFAEDPYVITNVVEEDTSITASNPMFLVQVSATDADINRPTNIRYSLLGSGTQPPEKYFDINAETGQLYLLTSLDRDLPSGRATYQFNVRAQDELDPPSGSSSLDPPKFGYTSVQVKPIDINDNAPLFISCADGSVMEHSPRGSSVMTVGAIDYDEGMNGTVVYEIVEGPSEISNGFKFSIQPNTGFIQTNTNEVGLDRETTPTYTVVVKASDRGNVPMATETELTISLDDKNDQIPKFEKLIYQIEMSEALTTGPIGRVKATDDDVGENARLDYSLRNHLDFFYINTDENNNEGSINVFKSVDYENPAQRFFNLTVVVQDPQPTHTAVAYVEVTVTDFNDNAPQFVKSLIEVSENESAPVGTLLAHFSASDADSGMNAIFEYSIDQKTDPGHLFSVDQTGNVTIRKKMDRESQDEHTVHILAIDKGVPAQTGTATLVIKVVDVNDNYPNGPVVKSRNGCRGNGMLGVVIHVFIIVLYVYNINHLDDISFDP